MKTIKEWLNELPDGYRERALKNADSWMIEQNENSLYSAIISAFAWKSSPEGHKFWIQITAWCLGVCELPKLPEDE